MMNLIFINLFLFFNIYSADFKDIESFLEKYPFFIADFEKKNIENIYQNIFWKYKYQIEDIDIDFYISNDLNNYPLSKGEGSLNLKNLNKGQILMSKKKYRLSNDILIDLKKKFENSVKFYRKRDYLIANNFLRIALDNMKKNDLYDKTVHENFKKSAIFFYDSIITSTEPDFFIDEHKYEGLYNLSVIYYKYKNYKKAFNAAVYALNAIDKKNNFKFNFYRIKSEFYIKNNKYKLAMENFTNALKNIDTKKEIKKASLIFSRAGDIYFLLNNHHLSQDMYNISIKANKNMSVTNLILFAESLFWIKKFDKAYEIFNFAVEKYIYNKKNTKIDRKNIEYAKLRIADILLIKKNYKKAKIKYHEIISTYNQNNYAAKIANIRYNCLKVKNSKGQNIYHIRNFFKKIIKEIKNYKKEKELILGCYTLSYTVKENDPMLFEKAKEFVLKFPKSFFNQYMIEPIRKYQISQLRLLLKNEEYKGVIFFEKNKKILFPNDIIPFDIKSKLYLIYIKNMQFDNAKNFYTRYNSYEDKEKLILSAVFLSYVEKNFKYKSDNKKLSKILEKSNFSAKYEKYLNLIWDQDKENTHKHWILKIFMKNKKNIKSICNSVINKIFLIIENKFVKTYFIKEYIKNIINSYFPDILDYNKNCAYNLLDIETKLEDLDHLMKIYEKRGNWVKKKVFFDMFLQLVYKLDKINLKEKSKSLMKIILNNFDKNSIEFNLANQYIIQN